MRSHIYFCYTFVSVRPCPFSKCVYLSYPVPTVRYQLTSTSTFCRVGSSEKSGGELRANFASPFELPVRDAMIARFLPFARLYFPFILSLPVLLPVPSSLDLNSLASAAAFTSSLVVRSVEDT